MANSDWDKDYRSANMAAMRLVKSIAAIRPDFWGAVDAAR